MENAGPENAGPKITRWNLEDWKMEDQSVTRWKMQDQKMQDQRVFKRMLASFSSFNENGTSNMAKDAKVKSNSKHVYSSTVQRHLGIPSATSELVQVLHFPVLHFPVLQIPPSELWSSIFQSCIFHLVNFPNIGPAFSSPANST